MARTELRPQMREPVHKKFNKINTTKGGKYFQLQDELDITLERTNNRYVQ